MRAGADDRRSRVGLCAGIAPGFCSHPHDLSRPGRHPPNVSMTFLLVTSIRVKSGGHPQTPDVTEARRCWLSHAGSIEFGYPSFPIEL
jgi:hypothetical protein